MQNFDHLEDHLQSETRTASEQTTLPSAETTNSNSTVRTLGCFNALKHGGTSKSLFLPDEDPAQFEALLLDALNEHKPCSPSHTALVEDFVHARWVLWRRQRAALLFESDRYDINPPDMWGAHDFHGVELSDRYKTQAERAFQRASTNLRNVRKEQFVQEKFDRQLALQLDKLALARERFEHTKAKNALKEKLATERAKVELTQLMEARNDEHVAAVREQKELEQHPVQHNEALECTVVHQYATLTADKSAKEIIEGLKPTNARVRSILADHAEAENPPQFVIRHLCFPEGILDGYRHMLDPNVEFPPGEHIEVALQFTLPGFAIHSEHEDILSHRDDDLEEVA